MKRACATALAVLALAGTAHAGEPSKAVIEKMVADLRAYDALKHREGTLKVVLPRTTGMAREKYANEYEALKPKLYEAANRMELAVQNFERVYGKKRLCEAIPGELKGIVPSCAPQTAR